MRRKINYTYIILSVALAVCVVGMFFLGKNIFFHKEIVMKDFENMSKDEVFKWVTKNELSNYINYEYVYSDSVEDGFVISQSLEPDKEINDVFTITISKGSIIEIDVSNYKNEKEFKDFILKYPNVNIKYENDDPADAEQIIAKFSKNSIDIKKDELTVIFSSKQDTQTTNSDDNKDNAKPGEKVLIPNNLLGTDEKAFLKLLSDLGFNNLKKDSTKYYSFISKKDTIYSYDDGKFDTSKTIKYALSLGDYPSAFIPTDYNNKTLDDANKTVKKYNDLNAHIVLNTLNKETTNPDYVGKLSNCKCVKSGNNSNVTCDLYTKKIETKEVVSFSGRSEEEMLNTLKGLGFTKFNKTDSKYSTYSLNTVISNDTGSKKTNKTINYVLSLGQYSPNMSEYNGKTLNAARNVASNYNNKGANIEVANPQEEETNDYANDTLFNCSSTNSGKIIITCKIAKNYSRFDLPSEGIFKSTYSSNSYNETVAKLNNFFNGKFTNVHYNPVENAMSPGQIVNIKVDGNDSFSGGSYDSAVLIEIDICETQRS